MTQINPKYLLLIKRVKEKHPELKKLVEELKPWCIYKNINWLVDAIQTNDSRINELIKKSLNPKIIWQLDLYILSIALWDDYCIASWYIMYMEYKVWLKYEDWCFSFSNSIELPHWNISEYPDELLEKIKNIL